MQKTQEKERRERSNLLLVCDPPQYDPELAYGWIKRDEERQVSSNAGTRRLKINGAIDVQRLSAEIRFDDAIDAISTIALFKQIERAKPLARRITIICEYELYYRSKAVAECQKSSPIEILFWVPYLPNLKLIDRFWKFWLSYVWCG
jgi:hypothetical protein